MKLKNIVILVMAFAMISAICLTAYAANGLGISYTAKLNQDEINVSDADQTVTVTINANQEFTWDGIGFKVVYDAPLVLVDIVNTDRTLTGAEKTTNLASGSNGAGFMSESGENETLTNICVLTFTVPAGTEAGEYYIAIEQLEITKDYGEIWESGGVVSTTLTIKAATPAHTCSAATLTPVAGQGKTCTVDGWNDYYQCTEATCQKFYADAAATVEIPNLDDWKANDGKIPASHEYGSLIQATDAVHTKNELKPAVAAHFFCDECDTYFTESKEATTEDALKGDTPTHIKAEDDGDCTTAILCTGCDYEFVAEKTHVDGNDKNHVCDNDGCTVDNVDGGHTPAADDGDCTTAILCTECEAVTTEAKAAHVAGEDDGNCTTAVKCVNCEKNAVEAKSHIDGDDKNHVCDNDGCMVDNVSNHVYVDAICACGAVEVVGWGKSGDNWYYIDPVTKTKATEVTRVPYPEDAIDGITYAPDQETLVYCEETGKAFVDKETALFVFDENGKFQKDKTGWSSYKNVNRYVKNGLFVWNPGFVTVDEELYYFIGDEENGGNIPAQGMTYIIRPNDVEGYTKGEIAFFKDGQLDADVTGTIGGNYYLAGKRVAGLVEIKEGYIYVRSNGELVTNKSYWITNTNDTGVVAKAYVFDENGVMQNPIFTTTTGIVDGYYYKDGKLARGAGLVKLDNDYYYVRSSGQIAVGEYWITNTNDTGVIAKSYTFDENGVMQNPEFVVKGADGVVDGYYYVDGEIAYGAGLVELDDGSIIYVRSNGQLAIGKYWPTTLNGVLPAGEYDFGADGMLVIK